MTLKSKPPLDKVDPIAYAWERLHRTPLPIVLCQSNSQRAGCAIAVTYGTGRGHRPGNPMSFYSRESHQNEAR